jgi:hypothetical protein
MKFMRDSDSQARIIIFVCLIGVALAWWYFRNAHRAVHLYEMSSKRKLNFLMSVIEPTLDDDGMKFKAYRGGVRKFIDEFITDVDLSEDHVIDAQRNEILMKNDSNSLLIWTVGLNGRDENGSGDDIVAKREW